MLENLIFILNGTVPIFILIIIGNLMLRKGFITHEFVTIADKLVFKLFLPAYLFKSVYSMDRSEFKKEHVFLVLYAAIAIIVIAFGTLFLSRFFIKDRGQRGAFAQGVYRSNTAILGIPFAANLFGDEGAMITALLLAFMVPLFNVIAVIILSICGPSDTDTEHSFSKRIMSVVFGIVKNPLIISIVLAILMGVWGIKLPEIANKSIGYLSNALTPLSLIAIGANFSFSDIKGRAGLAIVASALKTVAVPLFGVGIGVLLGFNGMQLGALFITFGTPAAVSSYVMAKNMHNDYKLAGQILVFSTLMSAVTIAMGSFILFESGLIVR